MITIDGSQGEGGGQILRTSLALSLVTGKPFRIDGVRAGRKKPGLMRQHLTAVNAAAEVGDAAVTGNAIGSQSFRFSPKTLRGGRYHHDIGSAGSGTLVLQALLPALAVADAPSEVIVEGGTHNPFAPPFDFLAGTLLPLLGKMGVGGTAVLQRHGFYPAGGGKFSVTINPARKLERIELLERGEITGTRASALVSKLPLGIAERELAVLGKRLRLPEGALSAMAVENPRGPGNVLTVTVESRLLTEVFTGFGERGVSAERVAGRTVGEVREYLASGAPVGKHLADQLLVFMAIAGGGRFRTQPPTRHTTTNIEVIRTFLEIDIRLRELDANLWEVAVG